MKNKIYRLIPVFILSFNLLLGYSAVGSNNIAQNSNIQKNNNQKSINKYPKISQLVKELKESITSFNNEVKLVVKTSKNRNEVTSKNIQEKINSLLKELNLLIQDSSISDNSQIVTTVENIVLIITEINKIITPLEKGLTENGVSQVQKDLGFFSRRKIADTFYGNLGVTTQEEIELFTTNKIQELDKQILSLQQLINQQPFIEKTSQIVNSNQVNNSNSELEIRELKNHLNRLSLTTTIGGFILLIALIFCIYRIITLVEEQRKIIALAKNNKKNVDIDNFQIEMNEIYKNLKLFDERLKQLEKSNQNHNLQNYSSPPHHIPNIQPNKDVVYSPKSVIIPASSSVNISNSNNQLVSTYNINSRSLSHQAITVSESEYTAEQRHLGRDVAPILESNNRGNYWIIKEGNQEYIVPKGSMKINEHNYRTISTFFECLGYSQNAQNNFTLVKPAKVASIGEKWQLIEIGQLQF
ncbi:hypothetical protein FJR38_06670 [Anabaena sp. UHCC 0253]|uniref:hypothetical protein n=1 Tax=Anabaena sp. UHCC 0253 TaxID=2590019 RepID=UPI0014472D6B|nr:hypothetical protein [Anabaena sp. UHCC 0253]MTJ52374.1 hypothetical protein [Anabaena sp. UHCC 0253]